MIGLMRLLVKSGPGDLNRQDEPKINCESHTSIKSPCAAAAYIKKATNGECITLVNKSYLGTRMCCICFLMLVVIVPAEVSASDETRRKK